MHVGRVFNLSSGEKRAGYKPALRFFDNHWILGIFPQVPGATLSRERLSRPRLTRLWR